MTDSETEKLRYPIGVFVAPQIVTTFMRSKAIDSIESFPAALSQSVKNLNDAQLDSVYRPDGWTIRQVVHHCADSHMNAFIRMRLALTQETPTINSYREDLWSEMADNRTLPVRVSLQLLQSLHHRWAVMLRTLSETDWARTYIHPQYQKTYRMDVVLLNYEWHCNHHLAHIKTRWPLAT
jgi:DinB superfamily